jgi:sucrose-6-phosphate hydrolase SacC (GH32 family)
VTTDKLVRSPRGLVELGAFEEVLNIPGQYLNDHCFVRHQGKWHFFGIVGPVGKSCFDEGSETSFAHATSRDLRQWELHDDVMSVCGIWPEISHVYAPNIIEHNGTFYMLYTALDGVLTQRLCLATSTDLFHWERYAGNPVIVPSLHWARWPGAGDESERACRDPHIFRLDDGSFIAYWVAELRESLGHEVTCVAASVSDDLVHWQEVGPVFHIRTWDEPPTRAAESPCVVYKDGKYWLFFKHGWWTHVVVSDNPLDFRGAEPARLGFCHASEVFEWEGVWWISHCSADPADYAYRKSNRTRGLFLGRLDWSTGSYPRLV